jgi:SOS response regulatory protein OraA/RecX
MDSAARAEGSSSPSAKKEFQVRIESVRFDASGTATIAVSGGFVFFIHVRRFKELHAAVGALIPAEGRPADFGEELEILASNGAEFEKDDPLFTTLTRMDEEGKALRKAVEFCSRAEQHRGGLELKLRAKGFGKEATAYALDRLEAESILDDARYASIWARARLRRKPMGPAALTAELRAKGLGAEAARSAVEEIDFGEVLAGAARREMERGTVDRESLKASLRRQGFGYEALSEFLEGLFSPDD